MLKNYICRQISAKYCRKQKAERLWGHRFSLGLAVLIRLSSTISKQDSNQNVGEVLT